jgi:hypothetical protein
MDKRSQSSSSERFKSTKHKSSRIYAQDIADKIFEDSPEKMQNYKPDNSDTYMVPDRKSKLIQMISRKFIYWDRISLLKISQFGLDLWIRKRLHRKRRLDFPKKKQFLHKLVIIGYI